MIKICGIITLGLFAIFWLCCIFHGLILDKFEGEDWVENPPHWEDD